MLYSKAIAKDFQFNTFISSIQFNDIQILELIKNNVSLILKVDGGWPKIFFFQRTINWEVLGFRNLKLFNSLVLFFAFVFLE